MDDPGPPLLLAAGGPPLERLRERSGPVTSGRVHDHAGRLVDHEQVLVLIGDAELGLRLRRQCLTRRNGGIVDLDRLTRLDEVALGPERAVDPHVTGVD